MGIFKAYDIRGIYPSELHEKIAYKVGKALVDLRSPKTVLVGRDMRESSPVMTEWLVKGITEQGADVVFAGMVDTPMFYFCAKDYDAGVMVTASHNPGQYNGFKICGPGTMPMTYDSGIKAIEDLVLAGAFKRSDRTGQVIPKDFIEQFVRFNLAYANGIRRMKVIVDTANGMGGLTFPAVFKHLDADFECMYQEPDGRFPNHEADPLKPQNMKYLQHEVIKKGADIGIAPDGDADRCFFTDENGEIIAGDLMTALIAKKMLEDHPRATILYDLRASRIVKETIEQMHGKALMCRVGHSYIKDMMRKEDAVFAGEVSGHFYYKDNSFAESSIITALTVMKIMSEQGKKLSVLVEPLRKYHKTPEINFHVKDKDAKMTELARIFYDANISYLDGIKVEYDTWWFNVRASNTEPLLRLNLEAESKDEMLAMQDKVSKVIMN